MTPACGGEQAGVICVSAKVAGHYYTKAPREGL